jgi:hypothetical protein
MFLPGKKYLTLSCEETLFFFPIHFSLDYLTGVLEDVLLSSSPVFHGDFVWIEAAHMEVPIV